MASNRKRRRSDWDESFLDESDMNPPKRHKDIHPGSINHDFSKMAMHNFANAFNCNSHSFNYSLNSNRSSSNTEFELPQQDHIVSDTDSDIEILPNSPLPIDNSNQIVYNEEKNQELDESDHDQEEKKCQPDEQVSMALINPSKQQLLMLGYDEYHIDQCLKYISTKTNNDNVLMEAIDWISNNKITEEEHQNMNIIKLCNIMECTRYQALYALEQSNHRIENAMQMIVHKKLYKLDTSITIDSADNIFDNLTKSDVDNLRMRDSILTAKVLSLDEEKRRKQQFKSSKNDIISQLRSMGFLSLCIDKALNDKSVKDKQSAMRYIINNPLTANEERQAKICEITNSGYSKADAIKALDIHSQNLMLSLQWLMEGKPHKIKHFIYHIETKNVLQIASNGQEAQLCDDVGLKNTNQHFSFYKDGIIKNFAHNKLLAVKCTKESYSNSTIICYKLVMISDFDNDDDDDKKENDDSSLGLYKFWEIDEKEKTIKNKECGLYLVYRKESKQKFNLEQKIHSGQMEQRWCFVEENELLKINPKELKKSLDSTEFECVICWENEPDARLEPCGHSSFCQKCIDELKPTECPICRTKLK